MIIIIVQKNVDSDNLLMHKFIYIIMPVKLWKYEQNENYSDKEKSNNYNFLQRVEDISVYWSVA